MAPLTLRLKAFLLRTILSLLTNLDLYLSTPLPNRPSFRRRIKATHASIPGSIDLLFYTPPSYKKPTNSTKSSNPSKSTNPTLQPSNPTQKHSLLINFHGGGFTLGTPQEDARFLTQAISSTGALAVSISYRLAPQHPFPTAIQDCISAILYLWSRAEELSIDPSRTVLSGFSAGGNLSWAVALKLCEEIERMRKGGEEVKGRIVGLVPFYGSVDWSKTRVERDASNPNLISVIPHWVWKPPSPFPSSPLLFLCPISLSHPSPNQTLHSSSTSSTPPTSLQIPT